MTVETTYCATPNRRSVRYLAPIVPVFSAALVVRMTRTYRLKRDHAPSNTADLSLDPDLNEEQRAVVLAGPGANLVIAGAGTGKTRALTTRVAYLVQQGVPIENILLLTFTNRAAREMTTRVEQLLGQPMYAMSSGTFHSIGRRFVTEFGATLGFPEATQIIDREDSATLLRQCFEVIPDEQRRARRFPKPSTILDKLSKSINTGKTFEEVMLDEASHFADLIPQLYDVLVAYQQAKVERGLVDFDDLLIYWHRLLTEFPAIAERISGRYQHVLVDEYQDTNLLQAEIVDRMSAVHGNLTVVGDDHQSIYSFRGAVHDNILRFGERHPGCQSYFLTQNYRSSPEILRLANLSIKKNTRQYEKTLHANTPSAPLPALINARDQKEEAMFVAQRILEALDEGIELSKICVLYRAHSHVAHLELELGKRGIPYVLRSGLRLFERAHIKDAMSFLRLVVNPRDDLAAMRALQLCEGIGEKTARSIATMFGAYETISEAVDSFPVQSAISRRAQSSFATFAEVLKKLDQPALRGDVATAVELVVDGFYGSVVHSRYDLPKNRLQDLDTLIELASSFADYDEFLNTLALDADMVGRDILQMGETEGVVLSSVHQAKGLEFNTVFILSMNEEKFPIGASMFEPDELEEERRLFYVAATRAQRELYLCRPLIGTLSRNQHGPLRLSPFVVELSGHEPPVFESWSLE